MRSKGYAFSREHEQHELLTLVSSYYKNDKKERVQNGGKKI